MVKPVDVDLRITAKNLSKKTLAELTGDVERLTEAQKAQAKSSDLAARSMKDLVAEQNYLAKVSAELARRSNLAQQFSKERAEIEKTAVKVKELAALRKRAAVGYDEKAQGPSMKALDQSIAKTEKELVRLNKANETTGASLRALGVDSNNAEQEFAQLSAAAAKSAAAYNGAVDDVARYGQAVERNNAILAEAARREREAGAGARAGVNRFAGERNAGVERTGQLAALKADIKARSEVARAADIQAEAQRRVAAASAQEAVQQAASEAAIRKSINAYVGAKNARVGLTQAFAATATAQEKEAALNTRLAASQAASNERKARLVALLKTERGQRLLNVGSMDQDTAATNRNAAATNRAAKEQAFFSDTGRKSLSVYQRIRGQVLGLAAAYIGVYQVIGTFNNALDAVNRNQALVIGLKTVNNGDARAAASDYKFLADEADRLGLVFDDIAPKFAGMAIAGKAVGLTTAQIRDAFSNVAESVAAGNLSIEDSEGVFRAVVQVMSKARVQAEELRGQLGDRLPGAVAAFAKANNIALTDLDEHLKKGKGNIDQFLKFLEQYSSQYAPTLDEATTRLQANINRAKNAYNNWLRELLSSKNQTALKSAFKAMEDFFKGQDGQKFAEGLGKAFKAVVDTFIFLSQNIELVSKVLKAFLLIQVVKFGIDAANSMKAFALQIAAVGTASSAANVKLSGTALAFSNIKKASVGLIAILGGITLALNDAAEGAENATSHTERYINTLLKAGNVKTLDEAKDAFQDTVDDIDATTERVKLLKKALEDTATINPLRTIPDAASRISGDLKKAGVSTFTSAAEIRQKIATEEARIASLRLTQNDVLEKQNKLLGEQLVIDEKARAEAGKVTAPGSAGEKAKKEKGPSAEDDARRQATAQRAIEREILDSQDNILQAQMHNGKVSDEMLERNHELQLQRNQVEYDDQLLKIEGLQQAAVKASQEAAARGRPVVDVSSELATLQALAERQKAVDDANAERELTAGRIEIRERAVNDLIDARQTKLQLINTQVELGMLSGLEGYTQANLAQDEYNAKIQAEIAAFNTLISTIQQGGPLWVALGLDETVAKMKQANVEATKLSNMQLFKNKFGAEIAGGIADAFVVLSQGIAGAIEKTNSWTDAIKGAWDAFRSFAADFLQKIAAMIVQAIILQAIQNAINGTSGGYGQAIGAVLGGTGHTGGVVQKSGRIGHGNAVRAIPISAAANAGKFHEGGLPGLKSNEVVSILKKREEVVTADDPRNVLNGGMSAGGGDPNVTIVNSIDSASVVKQGWGGARNVILNDVKANQAQWRANLGLAK